jgi:hypothetical protein
MAQPSNAMLTSFKQEILVATHDFTASTGDAFKLALYKAAASIGTHGAADTNYSSMGADELANGSGYTTGGAALTSVTPTTSGTTALCDFADVSWSAATFTTSGGMIYNDTKSDKGVSNHNFGGDQSVTAGTFTVVFPVADASNAVLRIA